MQPKKRRPHIMIVTKKIDTSKPFNFTKEQIAELEALKNIPAEPDEDCPELTDKQLSEMVLLHQSKLNLQKKQIVSIRLSLGAVNKAKAFGKGYTSLLSQILEKTLANDELLKHYL